MATLLDGDRGDVWAEIMQELSDKHFPAGFNKTDLRAAVDAADQWVSDNESSYNTSLPEPFKSTASAKGKALVLTYVLVKRYVRGV